MKTPLPAASPSAFTTQGGRATDIGSAVGTPAARITSFAKVFDPSICAAARLGDPETQSILPLLEGDILGAFAVAAGGDLGGIELSATDDAAVIVVITGGEYPAQDDSGSPITGIDEAEATGAFVFQAGTALRDDQLVTNGGRILNVTAIDATIAGARERAYEAAARISFAGARYRTDIARQAAVV